MTPSPQAPLSAPDHMHGDLPGGPPTHRSPAERAEGRAAARRSLRKGGAMVLAGVAALFVPVRGVAVFGAVVALLGFLVLVVAGIQYAVLRGEGDAGEEADPAESGEEE